MKKILTIALVLICIICFTNIVSSLNLYISDEKNDNRTIQDRAYYEEKYSVIIVGTYGAKNQEQITGNTREQYYEWFTGSAQRRFDLLTEKYNFNPENIYVLLTERHEEGYNPSPIFDSSKFINYYNATKENITYVFNELKNKVDENDLLLVDLIGHGGDKFTFYIKFIKIYIDFIRGLIAHDTYMGLEKDEIEEKTILKKDFNNNYFSNSSDSDYRLYDKELGPLTNELNTKRTVFILQPCFSGGFINDLSKKNHVIITSSNEAEVAGDFLGPLNNGLDGAADLDLDGRISLAEVFQYTIDNLPEQGYHPMIDDNGDCIGYINLRLCDGKIVSKIFDLSYEES